jgi:hypothetical protein
VVPHWLTLGIPPYCHSGDAGGLRDDMPQRTTAFQTLTEG